MDKQTGLSKQTLEIEQKRMTKQIKIEKHKYESFCLDWLSTTFILLIKHCFWFPIAGFVCQSDNWHTQLYSGIKTTGG